MDFRDYLTLAQTLAGGATEAEWRTACSRAYYAAFHVARDLLTNLGFRVPHGERAHSYLWLRLSNSGDTDIIQAGGLLNDLRRERNRADYDDKPRVLQTDAADCVQLAEDIIQALDVAAVEPVRTQITDTMKVYERDILRDVTWHP